MCTFSNHYIIVAQNLVAKTKIFCSVSRELGCWSNAGPDWRYAIINLIPPKSEPGVNV